MIIIFAIFLSTVIAQQEKYIDLLPDEEKQQFLDNVARRIMESFESNGRKKGSIELTDAQLKKHNSYVQSVMKQEEVAFEAKRNKREVRSSEEENKSKENDDFKEGLEVKPLQFRDNDVNKLYTSTDSTGLTTTYLNRRIYDIYENNLKNSSKMDIVTKYPLSMQTRSVTSDVNSQKITETSTIKNANEEKSKSALNSETQKQDSDPVVSTTESQILIIEITTKTPSIALKSNLQYEPTSETSVPLPVTVTNSKQEVDNVPIETATGTKNQIFEYDSANNSDVIYFITKRNNEQNYTDNHFEPSLNATEFFIQDSSDGPVSSSLTDESTTNLVKDTTTSGDADLPTTINFQILTTTTQNTALMNTATAENYSAVSKDRSQKERLQTITETTSSTPILTTSNIKEEQSTKKPKKIKLSKTIKQPEITRYDTLVSYVASKALKNIKHELELKNKRKFIDSEIETTNKGNTHLNHYQVYEIPWPIKRDNQSFLRSQEPIKDQPHFVPVYKYSPNFVYYNPKNRLGPNEAEENPIEFDTNLREGNNDTHVKVEPSEFILQLNNELRKFGIHRRKSTTTTEATQTVVDEEKDEEETEEEVNEKEESTTTTNFINSDGDISYLTVPTTTQAPTTNAYESSINCESTDKESAGCEPSKEKQNDSKKKSPTISEILSATDEKDLLTNLAKLQTLNVPLLRTQAESKVDIYMNVLKDLILEDSKSLRKYDWLTTTVQIQTALSKILKLIKRMKHSKQLYPADLQILRYIVFLHNFSLEITKDKKLGHKLSKREKLLPRNKKNRKKKLLKEKGLINRVWLYLRTPLPDLVIEDGLSNLYEFLIDVQDGLFDLHEAIRHIAEVTKFERQNWYGNLKQVYLTEDDKQLRELLLHISMSRLVDLVEHSCNHSQDQDFIQFVKTNKKDAKRILEEIIFINDIVHEITINKE